MDWIGLVASVVQSFASLGWPAAIFGSVWLFREKLSELLPLLHLKYKDAEVSFRLATAVKEAEALPAALPTAETTPTQEEQDKFKQIAKISPRAAMLEVRTDIDEAVRLTAKAAQLLTPRIQSLLGLTRLLRSREVISGRTAALLDDLRVLGNEAAHSQSTDFRYDDALSYRSLADRVIAQLRSEVSDLPQDEQGIV